LVALHQPWCVIALAAYHLVGGHPGFFLGMSASASGSCPFTQTERCDHLHSLSLLRRPLPLSRDRRSAEPRTRSADNPPRHPLSRSGVLSTDKSPLPVSAGAENRLRGCHWSLGLAAAVQLPTRVHPHRCGLGLRADRLFAGASQATRRLSTSTIVWTSEHDHRGPDSTRIHHIRRTACAGDNAARGRHQPDTQSSGVALAPLGSLATTAKTSVNAPTDCPQPVSISDTRCRSPM